MTGRDVGACRRQHFRWFLSWDESFKGREEGRVLCFKGNAHKI